ncbi:MAG: hypothetical protein V4633_13390 [Pseudomonadota bacterium]
MDETKRSNVKECALVVLCQWREKDRAAIADRRNNEAQRSEFKARTKLRDVADRLVNAGES